MLQISGKRATAFFQLAEGHYLPHIHKRRLIGVADDRLLKHIYQRLITVRVDLRRNIRGITVKPNLLQFFTSKMRVRRHRNPK
ncbi:Uncharacterised protein [Shigella sonnei]|nr:Uncharacterised protein [Shigella sonnei]CSR41445.1 Uncharacterised protein [Shigella sonnei]CST00743.1 Uncharacterised protein [Shigella sonnei]